MNFYSVKPVKEKMTALKDINTKTIKLTIDTKFSLNGLHDAHFEFKGVKIATTTANANLRINPRHTTAWLCRLEKINYDGDYDNLINKLNFLATRWFDKLYYKKNP